MHRSFLAVFINYSTIVTYSYRVFLLLIISSDISDVVVVEQSDIGTGFSVFPYLPLFYFHKLDKNL